MKTEEKNTLMKSLTQCQLQLSNRLSVPKKLYLPQTSKHVGNSFHTFSLNVIFSILDLVEIHKGATVFEFLFGDFRLILILRLDFLGI